MLIMCFVCSGDAETAVGRLRVELADEKKIQSKKLEENVLINGVS